MVTLDVGTAAGLLAAALLIACPLMPSARLILLAQVGVGAAFAAHFAALDLLPAAAMNVLGAVQALAALGAERRPMLARAGMVLIPVMVATGLWFWSGPLTILAVMAMVLIAMARMQRNEMAMRLLLLGGALIWTAHDALAGAFIPLAADLATGGLGLAVLAARAGLRPFGDQSSRLTIA